MRGFKSNATKIYSDFRKSEGQLIISTSQSYCNKKNSESDLSIITGSDGVSLRLPQLFLSQQRLYQQTDIYYRL